MFHRSAPIRQILRTYGETSSYPSGSVEGLIAGMNLGMKRYVRRHVITLLREHVVDRERRVRVVAQEVVEPAEHAASGRN